MSGRIKRGLMGGDRFTQISNDLFRDKRISSKAKGVFGLISTHRDGFGLSVPAICSMSKEGRDAIKGALRELEEYGYLLREQDKDPKTNQFGEVSYFITDQPGQTEETRRSDPWAENPPTDPPRPLAGFPSADIPPAEDRTHKKTTFVEDQVFGPVAPQAAEEHLSQKAGGAAGASGDGAPAARREIEASPKTQGSGGSLIPVQRVGDGMPVLDFTGEAADRIVGAYRSAARAAGVRLPEAAVERVRAGARAVLADDASQAMQDHLSRLAAGLVSRGWCDLEQHLLKNPLRRPGSPTGDLPEWCGNCGDEYAFRPDFHPRTHAVLRMSGADGVTKCPACHPGAHAFP